MSKNGLALGVAVLLLALVVLGLVFRRHDQQTEASAPDETVQESEE